MKGKGAKISKIPALDAIEEAVKRSVEMDRPVHTTVGRGAFSKGQQAPVTLAGVEVATYTAGICAEAGAKLIFTCGDPGVIPIVEDRFRSVYKKAGAIEDYDSNVELLYFPEMSWNMAAYQLFAERNVGANIWVGYFGHEIVYHAEQGARIGAVQVAGVHRSSGVTYMVASCDYTLICEEMFAAGAYLSQDPVATSGIAGQDLIKLLALAFLLGAFALFNLGMNLDFLAL